MVCPRSLHEGGTYLRVYRGVGHCIQLSAAPPLPPEDPDLPREASIQVEWFYGATATGKTRRVQKYAFENQQSLFTKTSATKQWWDGYRGEEIVCMDDFRGNDMQFHEFLQFTDPFRRLDYPVQTKGGGIKIKARTIFVTSAQHPIDTWKSLRRIDNDWNQLERRLNHIWECTYYVPGDQESGIVDMKGQSPPEQLLLATGPIIS